MALWLGAALLDCRAATGGLAAPFSLRRRAGVAWLAAPDGRRFFSLGVCCVDQGTPRDQFTTDNPGYAAWRHYPDSNRWAAAALERLDSWGFTTIGGWSDFASLRQCPDAKARFTPVLHVGSTAGAPWWDMWDPKNIARMDQVAREQILAVRDEPRLLGYYSDNEIGWWNAARFRMTLEPAPTSGQRRRLLELLRQTYHDRWSQLLRDFEPEDARNFAELGRRGRLYLRGGGHGIRAVRRFLGLPAERYYSLVRAIIRRYDRRGLILGDRYQSFYYPEVARAAARHVDAISSNLNAGWNDGSFARYYLETLHRLTGRPVLVSQSAVQVAQLSGINLNTRCLAALMLPAALFGRPGFQPGDRISFSATFQTHCQAYRTEWAGVYALGEF